MKARALFHPPLTTAAALAALLSPLPAQGGVWKRQAQVPTAKNCLAVSIVSDQELWETAPVPAGTWSHGARFFNRQVGVSVGDSGNIVRTTDGGQT